MKSLLPRSRTLACGGALLTTALLLGCSPAPDDGAARAEGAGVEACALPSGSEGVAQTGAGTGTGDISTNPESASGYRTGMQAVRVGEFAVATANPEASYAACKVLEGGGTAADALISAQMVLGLVEPQSSGIGGGSFVLYYDAATQSIHAYDGRETAPASADENYLRWISDADRGEPVPSVRASGRSIGVPGTVRLLEMVHGAHGSEPWGEAFDAAIDLAERGFAVSPRLAGAIAESADDLAADAELRDYFFDEGGAPVRAGADLQNPAYAETLRTIAAEGADGFYRGPIAESIIAEVADTSADRTAGTMTLEDLAGYEAIERDPVCADYRDRGLCSMPPPSSGGLTVAQALGILDEFDLSELGPDPDSPDGGLPSAQAIHLVSEAERLAYADRNAYIADPDFVPLPGGSGELLLDPDYLADRAALIDPEQSMGVAEPGRFTDEQLSGTDTVREKGTSHISITDREGNVAAMTTTIEAGFGAFHMTRTGFLLNNELTDFSAEPVDENGAPVANRVEPGKRPRSSMSPTLIFELSEDGGRGEVIGTVGSPGGALIIQYVAKAIIGMTDWGMDPQQAISMANFGAQNTPVTGIGGEHPVVDTQSARAVVAELQRLGHEVSTDVQVSGASALMREGDAGWIGGADPRREGVVLGGALQE